VGLKLPVVSLNRIECVMHPREQESLLLVSLWKGVHMKYHEQFPWEKGMVKMEGEDNNDVYFIQ
jgi:hypothetical protein